MNFRHAILAATMLSLPLAAHAQPLQGLYVGAGGGLNILQQESVAKVGGVKVDNAHLHTKLGGVGAVNLGYAYGNGFRTEVEFSYRYNGMDSGSYGRVSTGIRGHEQKFGPMVNAYYDFDGLVPGFTPYLGAGVGYQWVNDKVSALGFTANQTKGSVALQGMAGVAMPIAAVPGLAVTAEYRFMAMPWDRDYTAYGTKITLNNDYNHSVMVGVRYAFGAAPAAAPVAAPVPAAVPASPVSRSYLVFFDWDKATLTDRARQIVAEAAASSKKVQTTRIEVNGYTDTSGTPRYNQGLSVRRAQAVAAELVRNGVPQSEIAIQGFGETHLLVATGPNVREPQNRRVEIIIR